MGTRQVCNSEALRNANDKARQFDKAKFNTKARQLEKADFNNMLKLLLQRERVLASLGVFAKPQFFACGDRIGFFHGPKECDYTFGQYLGADEFTAHVIDDSGNPYFVSPLSVFAI